MKLLPAGDFRGYLETAEAFTSHVTEEFPERIDLLADLDREWWDRIVAAEKDFTHEIGMLLLQSRLIWRGGVRAALSGHSIISFPVLRTSLEAACYAYLMADDEELQEVWFERDTSEEARKRFGKSFRQGVEGAIKLLQSRNYGKLAAWVKRLYETSITFGAHPNPLFMWGHVESIDEDETGANGAVTCFNEPDSENAEFTLIVAMEIGLTARTLCFLAAGLAIKDDFVENHGDVRFRMIELFKFEDRFQELGSSN